MQQLLNGKYFSTHKNQQVFNDLLLTESEYYSQQAVPWHYHENAYFSFILNGNLKEVNKKETIICSPGTLIFNNTHDPHYNKDHTKYTRQFYIEIKDAWLRNHHIDRKSFKNGAILNNPFLISLTKRIYREFKINDTASQISIEGLLLLGLGDITRKVQIETETTPAWVSRIKEIINDKSAERITLSSLSAETCVHPIYISQNFNKYFHCSLSEYIRKIRVEKSVVLLANKKLSITEVAYQCGFSDQSHYIRSFKEINRITPSKYRAIIFNS